MSPALHRRDVFIAADEHDNPRALDERRQRTQDQGETHEIGPAQHVDKLSPV